MISETENQEYLDSETLSAIYFVASTLAPFYLHDPAFDTEALLPLLDAFADADAEELADAWPFVEAAAFYPYARMITGSVRTDESNGTSSSTTSSSSHSQAPNSYDLDEFAAEYRRLFVGPAAKAAPPWGSVYTDRDGVTFGESTMQLKDWLSENGIAVSFGASDEPEDSLGALLALLAWLTQEKPCLVLDLLRLHVLPWSSHFLDLMEGATHQDFYRGLAGITRLSLEGMQCAFGLNVETPRFYR